MDLCAFCIESQSHEVARANLEVSYPSKQSGNQDVVPSYPGVFGPFRTFILHKVAYLSSGV